MEKIVLYYITIFISFLFVSCDINVTKYSPDEYIKVLKDDNKAIYCLEDSSFHINNMPKKLPETYVVYILNASCSFCIYTFVKFYKEKELMCDIPVCIIIDKDYRDQVEYYLEQANIEIDSKKIIITENNKIINGNIDNMDLNGHLYLINKSSIKEHVCYIDNMQF